MTSTITDERLRAAFGQAAPEHYAWQTRGAFVSECERELVRAAFLPLGRRVLDVGCGEGATLHHLLHGAATNGAGAPDRAVGIDLFEDKLAFARRELPECTFVQASAYELPFDAASFDHVLVRDVIHHLDEPDRFVRECARVLAPGGRVDVLEPCRNNPLVFLHALARPEERGELRSTMGFLEALLAPAFGVTSAQRFQPMPLHRVVFHPDLGAPKLAERPSARRVVGALERWAERVVPRAMWAYLHLRAVRA